MKIIITLDYELYLNCRTGTVKNCMIIPMLAISSICEKHHIKLSIFADIAYLYRLKELKASHPQLESDYKAVHDNLKQLSLCGHDIQLHIHPQWFYSNFDGQNWQLDFEHYKLSDMPPNDAKEKFAECCKILETIIGKKPTAYRAGGYSIQTYKDYGETMLENGIIVDSSVLKGDVKKSKLHYYDYSKVPESTLYRFVEDVTKESINGKFIELPVSTKKIPMLNFLQTKRKCMALFANQNKNYGDGGNLPTSKLKKIKSVIQKLAPYRYMSGNLDYESFFFLNAVFDQYQKKSDHRVFTIIGHPKNFSDASMKYLDEFISRNKTDHEFITISDIVKSDCSPKT